MMEPVLWNQDQQDALDGIQKWLNSYNPEVYRLFGYAGTGKTTLAKELKNIISGNIVYAAYTGKAAYVLGKSVKAPATTIHRLIYRPHEIIRNGKKDVEWIRRDDSPAANASLIVIDEVSMVDATLGMDLLSFHRPILVLGDPFQLQPFNDQVGFFTNQEPDSMLTQVMRHSGDILDLATAIREGGDWRSFPQVTKIEPDYGAYDVVICGYHRTRHPLNNRFRKDRPQIGDKVVCIRNDYSIGMFNGQCFTVMAVGGVSQTKYILDLRDDADNQYVVESLHEDFDQWNGCSDISRHKGTACLQYAWAMTCHKAQGSEFNNVLVINEGNKWGPEWLYTATTRAQDSVTIYNGKVTNANATTSTEWD